MSTVTALVLNPWWWDEVSGLWLPPGDRHILLVASGLTTTPRSLTRGGLYDRTPALFIGWFWVSWCLHLFPCPLYNPGTDPALGAMCCCASPDLDLLSLVLLHRPKWVIYSELEAPLLTLLSSVSQPSWCSPWDFCENLEYSIWFTTRGSWRDFTVWCYWCSWVGCRGSCDHREELQVSIRFSVSRLWFSLPAAGTEKERKNFSFVFKNLHISAYRFWLKFPLSEEKTHQRPHRSSKFSNCPT